MSAQVRAMTAPITERIGQYVAPLLDTLAALEHVSRHLHPVNVLRVVPQAGKPDEALRAARATEPWPDPYSALRPQLDLAADEAIAAFAGLRAAVDSGDAMMPAFRAMRSVSRSLEALYPLAGVLPPVNRFFLDPAQRSDDALAKRFLQPPPPSTGTICVSDDPDERGAVWMYVPETYSPDVAHPLVVALHGGSGRGRGFLWSWVRAARSRGAILIAPTSIGQTWALQGPDPDSPHLSQIVRFVRDNWNVDVDRILLTGMSDGGTFSYVSGLLPGSPFTHLAPVAAAFHPMLVAMSDQERLKGLPIHIIHGALDWMFPIDMAHMAQQHFRAAGADVTFRAIPDLSHTYAPELSTMIMDWLLR
jgi:phospholipase/carboxylesterase